MRREKGITCAGDLWRDFAGGWREKTVAGERRGVGRGAGCGEGHAYGDLPHAVLDAEPLGTPLPPGCSLNQSLSVLGDTCPSWTL